MGMGIEYVDFAVVDLGGNTSKREAWFEMDANCILGMVDWETGAAVDLV